MVNYSVKVLNITSNNSAQDRGKLEYITMRSLSNFVLEIKPYWEEQPVRDRKCFYNLPVLSKFMMRPFPFHPIFIIRKTEPRRVDCVIQNWNRATKEILFWDLDFCSVYLGRILNLTFQTLFDSWILWISNGQKRLPLVYCWKFTRVEFVFAFFFSEHIFESKGGGKLTSKQWWHLSKIHSSFALFCRKR